MQTIFGQQNPLELSGDKLDSSAPGDATSKLNLKTTNVVPLQSWWFIFKTSFLIAALAFGAWYYQIFIPLQAVLFGTRWTVPDQNLLTLPIWLTVTILLLVGMIVGFLVERERDERIGLYIAGFFLLWLAGGAAAAHLWRFDVLSIPGIVVGAGTFFVVQLRAKSSIEKRLTESIRRLAMTTHLLEGKRAEARTISGLQLLETVLPIDDIAVFQLGKTGEWATVGRIRENAFDKMRLKPKHAEWREGIELCDQSLITKTPAVQRVSGLPGAARVAVPLIHEGEALGALVVKFRENYEPADKNVLMAFASQLARNFQRKETRLEDREKSFSDFFSRNAAQHRLELFRLISGILTEQQFGSFAFAEMVDGYAVAYLDGTLAYVNKAMLKTAQVTGDRAKQLDLFGLLDRFKGGVFDDPRIAVRRVMQTGESYRHEIFLENRGQMLDLQISLVRESAEETFLQTTPANNNAPFCFMINVRDITASKENERLRSDMVSLMSHELRTPITSINGFAELLVLEENISDESREFLRIISSESQRLSKMLNTFLAVSKLEQSDKREVVKIPIRLDSIVHEVLVNLQPEARKKRIRLFELANAHLAPVAGDKDLITKAVRHLVDNAIKYSAERTTVTVSTALETDAVRVIVEDRGYGIPHDSIEKIWSKFYRVPRDGQDKDETSTGLGLSFVKEVVEQHGGAVFVESEPNQGSKFSFTLPRM
ncbi:MAG: HAMP domain-containing sensor histidine kinase [Pyrinomonadaceae bacterium]